MKFNKIKKLLFISSFVITNAVADKSCTKEIQELGYSCCSDDCEVIFSDIDGDWGFEDGHWCGCGNVEIETKTVTSTVTATSTTTAFKTTTVAAIVTTIPNEKGTVQGKIGAGMDYEVYTNNSNKNKAIFNAEEDSFSCTFERTYEIQCFYGPSHTNYDLESSDKDILVNFELGYWEIQKSRITYVGVYGEFDNSKLRFSIIEILDDPDDYFHRLPYKEHGVVGNYTIYSGGGKDYRDPNNPIYFKEIFSVRNTPTGGETFTLKKHFNDWKNLGFEFSKLTKLKFHIASQSEFINNKDAAGYVEIQNAFIKKIRQPINGYEKPLNSTLTPRPTPIPTPTPQPSNCSKQYKILGYDCCPSPCTVIYEDSYGTWGIYEGDWCGCDEK